MEEIRLIIKNNLPVFFMVLFCMVNIWATGYAVWSAKPLGGTVYAGNIMRITNPAT